MRDIIETNRWFVNETEITFTIFQDGSAYYKTAKNNEVRQTNYSQESHQEMSLKEFINRYVDQSYYNLHIHRLRDMERTDMEDQLSQKIAEAIFHYHNQ